jgi:hypothetical protein
MKNCFTISRDKLSEMDQSDVTSVCKYWMIRVIAAVNWGGDLPDGENGRGTLWGRNKEGLLGILIGKMGTDTTRQQIYNQLTTLKNLGLISIEKRDFGLLLTVKDYDEWTGAKVMQGKDDEWI